MKLFRYLGFLSLALLLIPVYGQAPAKKKAGKTYDVPYRLTDTQHVLLKAKINGQGPFNFIVDTGAPILFVATSVGQKVGLKVEKGWATLERFEMEGGVVQEKVKCRVETPFQLEGMNGMGLAGAELHGMIGYTVLARYKMEFDFTRDKMRWTELNFKPPAPQPVGIKAGGDQLGLELIGSLMKFLGFLSGAKANPDLVPRGFMGIEFKESAAGLTVTTVLANSPADKAGIKAGDRILQVDESNVPTSKALLRQVSQLAAGQTARLLIQRGEKKEEISVCTGEGL